jgi:hypothetical protein
MVMHSVVNYHLGLSDHSKTHYTANKTRVFPQTQERYEFGLDIKIPCKNQLDL